MHLHGQHPGALGARQSQAQQRLRSAKGHDPAAVGVRRRQRGRAGEVLRRRPASFGEQRGAIGLHGACRVVPDQAQVALRPAGQGHQRLAQRRAVGGAYAQQLAGAE